jgi:hypothetical protein
MKTILVIYTNSLITDKKEISRAKKYSFNTSSKVKVGDLIDADQYDTPIQVVKILPKAFKYFNGSTGLLSDKFDSTTQWEIRTLQIRLKTESEIIYGSLIK